MTKEKVCRTIIKEKNCETVLCKDCPFWVGDTCIALDSVRLSKQWLKDNGFIKKRLSLDLDEKMFNDVKIKADSLGLSVSAYVRYILKQH